MKYKIFFLLLLMLLSYTNVEKASATAYSEKYMVKFKSDINLTFAMRARGNIEYIADNTFIIDSLKEIQGMTEAIEFIEPDYEVKLFNAMNEEESKLAYHMQLINAKSAWDINTNGNEINIAVIDSGCYKHEELQNNLLEGYNYLSSSIDVNDNIGHGTHICGIICAENKGFGVIGLAHKAKIVPLKCFDIGYTTTVSTIIKAIYDAVDKFDCKVINMSFGLENNSKLLEEAIKYASDNKVISVAAVGNDGNEFKYFPAAYKNVIGVGSINEQKEKSSFSQHNDSVFVVAPGENIESLKIGSGYCTLSGTSQAAPMVAGLAAIALSIDENITPHHFMTALIKSAEDTGDVGYDLEYGYGMINCESFIDYLLQGYSYYLSPINTTNTVTEVTVINNSNAVLNSSIIFASYDNNRLSESEIKKISINPYEKKEIYTNISGDNLKCFLWSEIDAIRPLFNCRENKK